MENIFNKQKEFQELLKQDISTQEYKNAMLLGLFEETAEIKRETPSKHHKKNQTFNKDKFLAECVDAQLYLLNLVLSETSFEVFKELIEQKQKLNLERQKNGY